MKVFIAGPRAVTTYDEQIRDRLDSIMNHCLTVLVGDASGVDRMIQDYLFSSSYKAVVVYASAGKPRNNVGNWPVNAVNAGKNKGFDFYAVKDMQMAVDANYGFMIWNGISKGTLNNIINLTRLGKKSLVYFIPRKEFICMSKLEEVKELVGICGEETSLLYKSLLNAGKNIDAYEQMAMNIIN